MKQLFIDDHDLEEIDNLARKLHQPQKFEGNAVLRPEYRWENYMIRNRCAPVWDPEVGLFRLVYQGTAAGPIPSALRASGTENFWCYATSTDGVNWEKPFLGLYDYQEPTWTGKPIGKENNILPNNKGVSGGLIHDAGDADPGRRFKGFSYRGGELYPTVSGDCVHWQESEAFHLPSADVYALTRDEDSGLFIATVKHEGPYGRSFYLTTSEDFETWSEQELIFHADQIDQENGFERLRKFFEDPAYRTPVYNRPEEWRTDIYCFRVFRYEGLYLGTPVMHHWAGKQPPLFENVDSRKTVELACSRDLCHWERVADRTAFMELSPTGDGSAYDTGQINITGGPLRRNNELWFYYGGMKFRGMSIADTLQGKHLDACALCLAKLRVDGFVSLKGGIEWGSVLTKPLRVEGNELHVNVDSWRGRFRAEVLDAEDGRPIAGYARDDSIPAVVDSIDETLSWRDRADLSELRGQKVRLRFSLLRAELYSFWFAG